MFHCPSSPRRTLTVRSSRRRTTGSDEARSHCCQVEGEPLQAQQPRCRRFRAFGYLDPPHLQPAQPSSGDTFDSD